MEGVHVHLVETMDDVTRFHEWMGQPRDWLAFDVETNGLRWWDGVLRLGQIGDARDGWAFDWHRWSGAIIEALKKWQGPIVGSNIGFDVHWLEQDSGFELPWHQLHDSVVMGRLLNPLGSAGLKNLAVRHVDPKAAYGEKLLKETFGLHGWDWGTIPVDHPVYWSYGALDTVLAARVAEVLMPQLASLDLMGVYEMERPVQAVSYRMERTGISIDIDYCESEKDTLLAEASRISKWIKENLGFGNVGSNKQLAQWFLDEGEQLFDKTEGGDWSMDKNVLGFIIAAGINDRVKTMARGALLVRRYRKIANTYLKNFIEMSDSEGILHASLNTLAAKTGRQSVSNPSLQNLIRGPQVRDAFIPRPGRKLVTADFNQIEVRLLAHYCRDPTLIAAINSGNIHLATGRMIYQDESIQKGDPRYVPIKNATFSKIYGAGIPKFAITAGIPLDQAQFVMRRYDELYPGVNNFIGQVISTGRQRTRDEGIPWVRTPAGRLQLGNAGKEYVLVNYLIQGAAADVMKAQTVACANAGLQEYMMLTVHDELVLDVPNEDVEDVKHVLEQVMPDRDNWAVPLTIEVEVHDRWGDKYRTEAA